MAQVQPSHAQAWEDCIHPKRVLLAIESHPMRAEISAALDRDRHQVIELEDGVKLRDYLDGLRKFTRLPRPDVVVSTLALPGCGGLAVLLRERSLGDGTPFVLFCRGDEPEGDLKAAGGATAFLLPFPDGLSRLRRLLQGRTYPH